MFRRRLVMTACALVCTTLLSLGSAPTAAPEQAALPTLVAQTGHLSNITSADFSADGKQVITTSGDNTVRIWDVATGRELRRHGSRANGRRTAALSPDGSLVAISGSSFGARLLEVATGKLVRDFGFLSSKAAAFAPDGKRIALGTKPGPVTIYSLKSKRSTQLKGHSDEVLAIAWASNGDLFTGSADGTMRRWTSKGRKGGTYRGHSGGVLALSLSKDAKRVATLDVDGTVRVWRTRSDKDPWCTLSPENAAGNKVHDMSMSPDGEHVALGRADGSIEIWDTKTKRQQMAWTMSTKPMLTVAYAPEGKSLVAGFEDGTVVILDPTTGAVIRRLVGKGLLLQTCAVSADGRTISALDSEGLIWVLDAVSGGVVRPKRHVTAGCIAVSPSGDTILSGDDDNVPRLWRRFTGEFVHELKGHKTKITSVAFSPDGYRAYTGDAEGKLFIWDLTTGRKIRALEGFEGTEVWRLHISRDSSRVAGMGDYEVRVWDARSGAVLHYVKTKDNAQDIALTPDGRFVAVRGTETRIDLWDVDKQKLTRSFPEKGAKSELGHTQPITRFALSPDGKHLVSGGWDHSLRFWELQGKRGLMPRSLMNNYPNAIWYLPGGKQVVMASSTGTLEVWDARGGRGAPRLTARFETGGVWSLYDADGRFDRGGPNPVQAVRWTLGTQTLPLEDFSQTHQEPRLLSRALGWSKMAARKLPAAGRLKPAPDVEATQIKPDEPVFEVEATDRGGGVGPIEVHLNGKRVLDDARGGTVSSRPTQRHTVDLTDDPHLMPGTENTVEFGGWNMDRSARRRGDLKRFTAPGAPNLKPALWAIVCGVSDYAGEGMDLSYAEKDARDFAFALRLAGTRLFGADRTHIQVLASPSEEGEQAATKANLLAAFDAAKECQPGDVFVVYLAGHGAIVDDQYHYLLSGATSLERLTADSPGLISSKELMDLALPIRAGKRQLLVLDTCAAGSLRDEIRDTLLNNQRLDLKELRQATGMFVLAGCAADLSSFEAHRYGHGLLTYALLHGMSCGCPLKGGIIDVAGLVHYAWDMVPLFAGEIGGVQQPQKEEGDQSFDVGQLHPEDRLQIPIQTPKPMVFRASFQQAEPPVDMIGLSGAVNDALQARAQRLGAKARYMFVETDGMAQAYRISGRYTTQGSEATVSVHVIYTAPDGTRAAVGSAEVRGALVRGQPGPALIKALVSKAIDICHTHHNQ